MFTYMKKYIWNVLYALDQLVNAIFLGDPNETISSRCGRLTYKSTINNSKNCRLCRAICWFLNIIDPNHCHTYLETIEYIGSRDLLYPLNEEQIEEEIEDK